MIRLLLVALLLTGCAGTPIPPESENTTFDTYIEWRDEQWFLDGCNGYEICVLHGFVITTGDNCLIDAVKPEHTTDWDRFETLGELLRRCTDGDFVE